MNQDPMRIAAVNALPEQRLRLTFEDGLQVDADLSGWISSTRALARLADPDLFARAHVGDWGTAVVWIDGELDVGADNLRNLVTEQSGGIGHERLLNWLHHTGLRSPARPRPSASRGGC